MCFAWLASQVRGSTIEYLRGGICCTYAYSAACHQIDQKLKSYDCRVAIGFLRRTAREVDVSVMSNFKTLTRPRFFGKYDGYESYKTHE